MFSRMIETTAKCTWWTILFKLGSIIMHVILMVLIIVVASVIASSMTTWSIIVSIMAMATSTLIISIIAALGGVKLSVVALVLACIIILLSPSPLLRTSIWLSTTVLAPVGSVASVVTSVILVMVVIIYIFILFFLFRERGRWLRVLLQFGLTFTFLSSSTSCTFKWFG